MKQAKRKIRQYQAYTSYALKFILVFFEGFEKVMNVRVHFHLLCGIIIPREHVGIPSIYNIQKCLINAHFVCLK